MLSRRRFMALLGSVPVVGALVARYADTCTGAVSGVHTAPKGGLRGGRSVWRAVKVGGPVTIDAYCPGAEFKWVNPQGLSWETFPTKAVRDHFLRHHPSWRACE